MDPETLLQAMECTMRPEVEATGGLLDVCEDELAALQVLHNGPLRWCCLMMLTAGRPAGRLGGTNDHEQLTLTVYVAKPTGLPVNPAAGTYRDTPAGPPLLARVGQIRRIIQRLRFVEPFAPDAANLYSHDQIETQFTAGGWQLLGKDDAPDNNHACRLTFTIHAAMTGPAGPPLYVQLPVSADPNTPAP